MKGHTKINKFKIKHIIKDCLLFLLALTVCAFAVCKNGFKDTLTKLLTLIFYGAVGFIGFYVIYFIIISISKTVSAISIKKRKKLLKRIKSLEISSEKYSYNFSLTVEENFKNYFEFLKRTIIELATKCGYKGKYLYLNFTFIDALDFVSTTLAVLENKVDYILSLPIIKNFNLQDKPITVLEKTLNNLIEKEDKVKEKQTLQSKILSKTVTVGVKFLFKDKVNEELNKVVNYVGVKWCLIYTKNNKKLLKKLCKNNSNNNEGAIIL